MSTAEKSPKILPSSVVEDDPISPRREPLSDEQLEEIGAMLDDLPVLPEVALRARLQKDYIFDARAPFVDEFHDPQAGRRTGHGGRARPERSERPDRACLHRRPVCRRHVGPGAPTARATSDSWKLFGDRLGTELGTKPTANHQCSTPHHPKMPNTTA